MTRIDMPASCSSSPLPSPSWPGWTVLPPQQASAPSPPNDLTPQALPSYTHDYTTFLTSLCVSPQLTSFKKGFHTLLPSPTLAHLPPRTLKAALEGTPDLDISQLKRSAQYETYRPDEPYIQLFWRVVEKWPSAKQRDLLRFVTAAERVPVSGAGGLVFKVQEAFGEEGLLPTSSTCFGTLYLPRYKDEETLEGKLRIALEFGGVGFGTG